MITYLTWGETPRSYGVFGSQAIGQFRSNRNFAPTLDYNFISGVPVIHSGLVRDKFKYRDELIKIQERLGDIAFSILWLPTSQTNVNSNERSFYQLHGRRAHKALAQKLHKTRLVHCRSYHAAWAALQTRKCYEMDYKIIFDVRGFWPEEVSYRKGYSEKVRSYIFRKEVEKKLVDECDCVVSVSHTMAEHMDQIGHNYSRVILLSCDTKLAEKYPVNRGVKEKYCLTYCGGLGHSTWHSPFTLANLYRKFKAELGNTRLQLITTSSSKGFMGSFSEFESDEISITPAHSLDDVYRYLSEGDFYALSYRLPENIIERSLARSVLATKTAEYSAFGRTVLCNNYCGGASRLVENYDLGISYSPHTHDEITRDRLMAAYLKTPDRDITEKLFSTESHAKQYAELYEELLQ